MPQGPVQQPYFNNNAKPYFKSMFTNYNIIILMFTFAAYAII